MNHIDAIDNSLAHLFENNRAWAQNTCASQPTFFSDLAQQQNPEYMWIGCADSRVPANELIGLLPGEVFVHRNVANILAHSDLNSLSAMQYAIDVLQVKHIIICGHYGCGGVTAVFQNRRVGLVDNWLRHIHDIKHKYTPLLNSQISDSEAIDAVEALELVNGTEIELLSVKGEVKRFKLGWMSPARSVFIFSCYPKDHWTVRRPMLSQLLEQGRIRVVSRPAKTNQVIEALKSR